MPPEVWELAHGCLAYLLAVLHRELGLDATAGVGWQVRTETLALEIQHAGLRLALATAITPQGTGAAGGLC